MSKPSRLFANEDLPSLFAPVLKILKLSTPTMGLPHQEEGDPDSEGDEEVMSRAREPGFVFPFPRIFVQEWEEPFTPSSRWLRPRRTMPSQLQQTKYYIFQWQTVLWLIWHLIQTFPWRGEECLKRLWTTGATQPFAEPMRPVHSLSRLQQFCSF